MYVHEWFGPIRAQITACVCTLVRVIVSSHKLVQLLTTTQLTLFTRSHTTRPFSVTVKNTLQLIVSQCEKRTLTHKTEQQQHNKTLQSSQLLLGFGCTSVGTIMVHGQAKKT